MASDIALFSLDPGRELAERVARRLGISPGVHEERLFGDGEHKIRPRESVRGRDVFLLQSLYSDDGDSVNDRLVRTLFFCGALRDAGCARLTLVVPYLCYARKDRRTKYRDPVSIRYLAQLFETLGVDGVVSMDVHNRAAFDNAFRCPTVHLSAQSLFIAHLRPLLADCPVTVASPDVGGIKRADDFREMLNEELGVTAANAFMEKRRSENVISGDIVAGDLEGRTVVILDDLIAGGSTLRRAAEAFRDHGAAAVYAAVTHGLFSAGAAETLATPALEKLLVSDSVPPRPPAQVAEKVTVVETAPVLAEAIERLHKAG